MSQPDPTSLATRRAEARRILAHDEPIVRAANAAMPVGSREDRILWIAEQLVRSDLDSDGLFNLAVTALLLLREETDRD